LTNKIPVFLLTIKNSSRETHIRKKLKSLKIRYKIFYAIDGKKQNNYKILDKMYDKKECIRTMGRVMSYPEISNAEGHMRICKYIIKKNISNAIIMEDDCYPSKDLNQWLALSNFFKKKKYDVIQIYHSFGLIYKETFEVINKKFSIYETCFAIPYATCYQISKKACEYIVKKNKLISRNADWPINFHGSNLKQFVLLPHLVSLRYDHEETSCQKNIWDNYRIIERIRKFIPFYNIFTALFYLFCIPFIFRIYKDYSYYKERYFLRKYFFLKNLFVRKYINLENIAKDKSYYPLDLLENLKKSNLIKK